MRLSPKIYAKFNEDWGNFEIFLTRSNMAATSIRPTWTNCYVSALGPRTATPDIWNSFLKASTSAVISQNKLLLIAAPPPPLPSGQMTKKKNCTSSECGPESKYQAFSINWLWTIAFVSALGSLKIQIHTSYFESNKINGYWVKCIFTYCSTPQVVKWLKLFFLGPRKGVQSPCTKFGVDTWQLLRTSCPVWRLCHQFWLAVMDKWFQKSTW